MRAIAVAAISVNGYITNGDSSDVSLWTSPEDKHHFQSQKDISDVLIMGSTTYEAMRKTMKLSERLLRIVCTSMPEKFVSESVPGQLEFSDLSPNAIIKSLEERNKQHVLIAGGSYIYGSFLEADCIDEFQITIEPLFFASGTPLLRTQSDIKKLQLLSSTQLNNSGTMLNTYSCKN